MKKNLYITVAIAGLAIAAFVLATTLYRNSEVSGSHDAPSRLDSSLLVKDWSPSLGPTMARVVLVEFLDPECESCRAMHPILKGVLKRYEGRIRYVVRYMPFHQNSELAARWLEAAREQGKYWEALDVMFERQPEWADHHAPRPDLIPGILNAIGVDIEVAQAAKDNPDFGTRIAQDKKDGSTAGVTGTPTFFVNGKILAQLGESSLIALIESELEQR